MPRRAVRVALSVLAVLLFGALLGLVGPGGVGAQSAPEANADGSFTVPHDWALIPDGVGPGSGFRLLLVTSTVRDASSSDIAVYDAHVQAAAALSGAHDAIGPYASAFRALGCTATVSGREHTATSGVVGVPVFWLGGDKIADDYAGLYDGYWDSHGPGAPRDESGAARSAATGVFTGCGDSGAGGGFELGRAGRNASVGNPWSADSFDSMYADTADPAAQLPVYGLSPLLVVEGYDPHVRVQPPERFDVSTLSDASPPGLIFRVCPDGAVCDPDAPDDDPTWVPTLDPVVVIREGQGPVSYQYKVIGRKHGTYEAHRYVKGRYERGGRGWIPSRWETYQKPYRPWRRVDVTPNLDRFIYPGTTSDKVDSRLRLRCAHGSGDGLWPCMEPRTVYFGARDDWKTVTLTAVDDSDAFDHWASVWHATISSHGMALRDGIPIGGYPAGFHRRMAGVGDDRLPRVRVRIIDDEQWVPEVEVLGHGKADVPGNWIGLTDGGLQRSLPADFAFDTEYEMKLRLRRVDGAVPDGSVSFHLGTSLTRALRVWVHDSGGYETRTSKNADALPNWRKWVTWKWGGAGNLPAGQVVTVRLLAPEFELDHNRRTSAGTPEGARVVLNTHVRGVYGGGSQWRDAYTQACVGGCDADPPAVVPTVEITSAAGAVEGGDVSFGLSASPAPAVPLSVSVSVTTGGDFGVAPGPRSVVVGTDGVGTLVLPTVGDGVAESDGSVSLRVNPAKGYELGSDVVSSVRVEDDDSWPVVSIAAGRARVEGDTVRFTLTKSPATAGPVTVNVAVSQDGDWGAAGPSTVEVHGGTAYYYVTTVDDEGYDHPGSVTASLSAGYGYRVGSPSSAVAAMTDSEVAPAAPLVQFAALVKSFYDRISAQHVHGDGSSGALNKRFLKTMGHAEYAGYPQPVLTPEDAQRLYDHGGPGANKAWEGAPEAIRYKLDYDAGRLVAGPELTIRGGSAVTEGGTATFTITATPAPAGPVTVSMGVSEDGSWDAAGAATVVVAGETTTYTVTTVDDEVDEADGSVTARLRFGSGYRVGSPSSATVAVSDDDDPGPVHPSVKYASLIAEIHGTYIADHATPGAHTKWKRVLKAFGHDDYAGYHLKAMTSTEAQRLYDRYRWPRWQPIGPALKYAEDYDPTDPPEPPPAVEPVLTVSGGPAITEGATAVFTITADPAPTTPITVNMGVTQDGSWDATGPSTVTVTGATTAYTITTTDDDVFEPAGSVTATIDSGAGYTVGTASAASVDVSSNDPPKPTTPTITITGGLAVTEGGTATFTINASPAPASPITVGVGVTQNGSFGAAGPSTITVDSATTTYTITTQNDSADEPDGSVTATVLAGQGYRVSPSGYRATVAVSDDDHPVPALTITAGPAITEGGTATFTITASPAPAVPITVNIDVAQVGDWDAAGASTITVTDATTTYTVTTSDDNADELDGTVTATLQTGTGYTTASPSSATVDVSDDDADDTIGTGNADTLKVKIADADAVQRGQTLRFEVTLSEPAQQTVEIGYFFMFINMTKPPGPDTGLLVIPTGADHGHIDIHIPPDTTLLAPRPRVRIGIDNVRGAQLPLLTNALATGPITE